MCLNNYKLLNLTEIRVNVRHIMYHVQYQVNFCISYDKTDVMCYSRYEQTRSIV